MSTEEHNKSTCCGDNFLSFLLYGIGVAVVLLIGFILTSSARKNAAADEAVLRGVRGAERKEKRIEIEAKAKAHANSYGWRENLTNKITYIPVAKAMEFIVDEYADRDTAHSVLSKRVAVAAPPAPAPAAKDKK